MYQNQPDGIPVITKSASATLDYIFDWTAKGWLQSGEAITSSTVIVGTGLTQPTAASTGAGIVTVWLAGGTNGSYYIVTCRITTSQGRTDERSIRVKVAQR